MVSIRSGSKLFVSGGILIISSCIKLTIYFSCVAVKHEETWDEDNVKTMNVFRLETAPVEKEPGYMLAEESRAVYKKDDSYTRDREFEEPLPGDDEDPEFSVSAAKLQCARRFMTFNVKSFLALV